MYHFEGKIIINMTLGNKKKMLWGKISCNWEVQILRFVIVLDFERKHILFLLVVSSCSIIRTHNVMVTTHYS